MKKKLLIALLALPLLLTGCGCSKVSEATYTNAVSTYKNTDAISFTRIEEVKQDGVNTFTRKRVDAKFIFNSSNEVSNLEYNLTITDTSTSGSSDVKEMDKYYFNKADHMYYTYSKVGSRELQKYKESVFDYANKININACDNADCILMIPSNIAPIYATNEVSEFSISDDDGKGIVTFNATCPTFENCSSNDQTLQYNLVIGKDGNIESLNYEIRKGDTLTTIKYTFHGFGSNNVKIDYPSDLDSYIEKK